MRPVFTNPRSKCDEAHRTTGVTLAGEDESNFVRIHDADYLKAKRRLYITATPRIFAAIPDAYRLGVYRGSFRPSRSSRGVLVRCPAGGHLLILLGAVIRPYGTLVPRPGVAADSTPAKPAARTGRRRLGPAHEPHTSLQSRRFSDAVRCAG